MGCSIDRAVPFIETCFLEVHLIGDRVFTKGKKYSGSSQKRDGDFSEGLQ